ncbi:hypothetical protein SAMN04487895_11751 [Paenibacillus sophorae]|uniref:Uncharacterized protein n=1 Tax=Paenibacillus sophorae TaxID=1333845 RepID=A0A1H8UDJ8_9BACL|nr:hypothetical protein [Paenibacillus sophorae]QWU13167.1 hypothetical protein KP014_14175 [Paenibacillus sophorae]SEP01342.1 hypothetical protein SAMN04487895_11751 [Paenibacillus sophorae]
MPEMETARLLGKLMEATPQETEQLAALIHQHGTHLFWERLEEWKLPAALMEKLQAVKQVLQGIASSASEGSESDGPGPFG